MTLELTNELLVLLCPREDMLWTPKLVGGLDLFERVGIAVEGVREGCQMG